MKILTWGFTGKNGVLTHSINFKVIVKFESVSKGPKRARKRTAGGEVFFHRGSDDFGLKFQPAPQIIIIIIIIKKNGSP